MSEILTLPPKLPKSQNAEVGASKLCPGCGHGITLKALAKAIDELGIQQKTVFGCDIGCSLLASRRTHSSTGVQKSLYSISYFQS